MRDLTTARPYLLTGLALLGLPRFGALPHLGAEWALHLVDWIGAAMVVGFAVAVLGRRRHLPADPVVGWSLSGGALVAVLSVVAGSGLGLVVGFSLLTAGIARSLVLLGADAHDSVIRRWRQRGW